MRDEWKLGSGADAWVDCQGIRFVFNESSTQAKPRFILNSIMVLLLFAFLMLSPTSYWDVQGSESFSNLFISKCNGKHRFRQSINYVHKANDSSFKLCPDILLDLQMLLAVKWMRCLMYSLCKGKLNVCKSFPMMSDQLRSLNINIIYVCQFGICWNFAWSFAAESAAACLFHTY